MLQSVRILSPENQPAFSEFFKASDFIFLTQCARSIVEVEKKVQRLGGNGEVASMLLEQFLEEKNLPQKIMIATRSLKQKS